MNEYEYKYKSIEELTQGRSSRPFFRQLFISSSVYTVFFYHGLSFGTPTVAIPQIRKEANTTAAISDSMASWISSVFGYSGLPWVVILSYMAHRFGRKVPTIFSSTCGLASFILLYLSQNPLHILVAQIIQAVVNAFCKTVALFIMTEYTSPHYRGILFTLKTAIFYWGVWVANCIGAFAHWKYIPLLGCFITLYSITAVFWHESPYWLASKRRFKECEDSFKWCRGLNNTSRNELKNLISIYTANVESSIEKVTIWNQIKRKEFYQPILLGCAVMGSFLSTGKLACVVYILEIMKLISKSESAAYIGMLVIDGVTILSMYVGCWLTKYITRRNFLLRSGISSTILLFVISLYLYLIEKDCILENKYVTLGLLTVSSIAMSCGLNLLATSVAGELLPLQLRNFSAVIVVIFENIYMGTILKTTPYIYKKYGLHIAFLCYGLLSSIFLAFLYKYLPETRDKTLQEIENSFKNTK